MASFISSIVIAFSVYLISFTPFFIILSDKNKQETTHRHKLLLRRMADAAPNKQKGVKQCKKMIFITAAGQTERVSVTVNVQRHADLRLTKDAQSATREPVRSVRDLGM